MANDRDVTNTYTPDNDNDSWPPHEFFPKLPWVCDGEISKGSDGSTQYTITFNGEVSSGGAGFFVCGAGKTREEAYSDFLRTCGELGQELFRFMTSQIA